MSTAELLLGVIALSVFVMAAIQVGAIIAAVRVAKQVNERVDKLTSQIEQDIKPLLANVASITSEAAHAAAVASRQVDRADQLFGDVIARVDDTISTAQHLLKGPARNSMAILTGVQAAVSALKGMRESSRRRRTMGHAVDDEESLFIG